MLSGKAEIEGLVIDSYNVNLMEENIAEFFFTGQQSNWSTSKYLQMELNT
jgi:hypothetical protein